MRKFLRDTAGTLVSYPRVSPERGWLRRQPASCTVRVIAPGLQETSFSAATVQSYSTTLSAAASEGDTEVTVAAATGFVDGRRYLINIEGSDDLEVEAKARVYASAAFASYTLSVVNAATGADFEGVTFTFTDNAGTPLTSTFEFDTGGGVSGSNVAIVVLAGDDASTCLTALAAQIQAVLGITCAAPAVGAAFTTMVLTQDDAGAGGNTSVLSDGVAIGAFTGGITANTQPTTLVLAEPIPRAIASGAALRSWAVTYALTTTHTDTAGYGLARFKAVVDSVTYDWDETFRVCNRIPVSTLTPTRLTQAFPIIATIRPRKDVDFEETIEMAWRHEVLPTLEIKGFLEDYIQNTEALEPMHALACVLMLARPNPAFPRETLETLEALWLSRVEATLARASWYAQPPTEDPGVQPETGNPQPNFAEISR